MDVCSLLPYYDTTLEAQLSLECWSAVRSLREIEATVHLMVQLKEKFEAPLNYILK